MLFTSPDTAHINLDANATSPLDPEALRWMELAISTWGNPSSTHQVGRSALELLDKCRLVIAHRLHCQPQEVVFTSGGSEANTSVLVGKCLSIGGREFKLLVSPIEHASVQSTLELLKAQGASIKFIPLTTAGQVNLTQLESILRDFKPHLTSVMVANNETGIIHPIPEIAALCSHLDVEFHTDAVQAFGKVRTQYWCLADYVSVSAHKVGGPKGIGALRIRDGRQLIATHRGGSQELKRRGGTQNMVGIAGFAGALQEIPDSDELASIESLRNRLEQALKCNLGEVSFLGQGLPRLPNTCLVRIHSVLAERIVNALDLDGILTSQGSACSSGSTKPSPVLLAMGLSDIHASECFRMSLSRHLSTSDIDRAVERIVFHAKRIRERQRRR